jgi:signal transduction histidine kinase
MTPEQRERAFDRFWRADSTTDGSGLGLAIVKNLAELGARNGFSRARPVGIGAHRYCLVRPRRTEAMTFP